MVLQEWSSMGVLYTILYFPTIFINFMIPFYMFEYPKWKWSGEIKVIVI